MQRRHPLPRLWMMTDERQGEGLWDALRALPRGAGVVFRHYSLPRRERRALFRRVRAVARRRNLTLVLAGPPSLAAAWGADGSHGGRRGASGALLTLSAHGPTELRLAESRRASLAFLSPVFPTRSHPEARPLAPVRFASLTHRARIPVIALGGMDAQKARRLRGSGLYGWAAIDAWSGG